MLGGTVFKESCGRKKKGLNDETLYSRDIVVHSRERAIRTAHRATSIASNTQIATAR